MQKVPAICDSEDFFVKNETIGYALLARDLLLSAVADKQSDHIQTEHHDNEQ